jgi:NRAMP (natural resistance-associated macrophage protein)-like metal ion transporter
MAPKNAAAKKSGAKNSRAKSPRAKNSPANSSPTKNSRLKTIFRMLGPGLVTGAADDDPSGIATYSQGGAQFGYALGWTMFLTAPFMIAIQLVSARIGAVTGQGVAANIDKALPRSVLHFIVGLLLIANTLNLAADVAAMGDALRLVVGGPMLVYIALFGIGCLAAEILIPYHSYSRYLKALTLVLFAYVATAFSIHIPWGTVAEQTFLPHPLWNRDYALMLVAIFGTTISPYMFFWQASLEAEGRKLRGKAHDAAAAAALPNRLAQKDAFRIVLDTTTGMVLSNIIGFFIIVTTAATLHAHGITKIGTAEQAAEALRPLAGPLAFLLFSLGIIGTGLLAVPVLAGSAAYAVAESVGWEGSLEMPARSAPGFYLIVAATTLAGLGAALTRLDPIQMLFWSAVVNGIVAVPLMVAMMIVVASRKIMGKFAASRWLIISGWCATALMAVVVAALLATSLGA